jgi:hypothetical protein
MIIHFFCILSLNRDLRINLKVINEKSRSRYIKIPSFIEISSKIRKIQGKE